MDLNASATNRAILLTPAGTAAIAVVRLCGPATGEFLRKHFSGSPRVGRAVHGRLSDGAIEMDDPIVVPDPNGQYVDISLHGGAWVVEATLSLAQREGFERVDAEAGPLDAAAIDADSLLEREVLQYLPLAMTEASVRMILGQPAAWARRLDASLPTDEVERIIADRSLHWMLHRPRVAVVGAPNVGKSTLANQLFAQEHSITADLPGTTRDWVGEIANIDGLAVLLVDTPGDRQTPDAIEAAAIARSAPQIAAADLVIVVLDATRPLEPEQSRMLARHPDAIIVANKIDLGSAWDLASLSGVQTVATTGKGVDELRSVIRSHFGCNDMADDRPRWWTERQRRILMESPPDQVASRIIGHDP